MRYSGLPVKEDYLYDTAAVFCGTDTGDKTQVRNTDYGFYSGHHFRKFEPGIVLAADNG